MGGDKLFRQARFVGKDGLWVMSFIYKYKTSTTYPLYETMQRFVLINKWHRMSITHNPPLPTIQVQPFHKSMCSWSIKLVDKQLARPVNKLENNLTLLILRCLQTFLNGLAPVSFSFIFGLFNQKMPIYSKILWKMSIQYTALGFKHTTSWLWASSLNHETRVPAGIVPQLQYNSF